MIHLRLCIACSLIGLSSSLAYAGDAADSDALVGRAEVNWRYGSERAILMSEFWVPLYQNEGAVLYGDARLMGDDQDNNEFNLGLGYREVVDAPVLGQGVAGIHGWFDRRLTDRGSSFNQATIGLEWLGDDFDILANGYVPLSDGEEHAIPNADTESASLTGTGILVDTNGTLLEEPQGGFDIELGFTVPVVWDDITDSTRLYGGGYYFDSDNTESVSGWRTRLAMDVTSDIQIGGRFQDDDVRGSQGFLEATIRFPFGQKQSYKEKGLYARLDESPERDIDIVTGSVVTDPGDRIAVVNRATGEAQEVLHVDNTAGGGGNGSAENPYNTLAAAEAAASAHTIIYVHTGNGTNTNQDQGITLNDRGQQLIGQGTTFVFNTDTFATANGASLSSSIVIAQAGTAPVITNTNATSDGITVTADDVTIAGVTVDGATRDGILVEADGAAASAQNVTIQNVTVQNNRMGVYVHGADSGAVSAKIQGVLTTGNSQHGIAIYDDTDDTFGADLGGGSMGSTGNNVLAGNTLEDLAVELDGGTLMAQNNWWGQATGADTDDPTVGIDPQIYYGAPINDGLVADWTLDSEWTTNATAYDRSGNNNDGTLGGGLSLTNQVEGNNRQALDFNGTSHSVDISPSGSLDINDNAVTISVWVKLDQLPGNITAPSGFGSIYDAFQDSYILYLDKANNELRFKVTDSDFTAERPGIFQADLDTTNWNLITGVYDGDAGEAYIYLNDELKDTHTNAALIDNVFAGQDASLGYESAITAFDGSIDRTSVYSRALSSSEIAELYRMDTSSSVNTSGFLTAAP